MSSVTKQNNNGSVYYYLSQSFRERGKNSPSNKKIRIGKLNKRDNQIEIMDAFKDNETVLSFIKSCKDQGISITFECDKKRAVSYSALDVLSSKVLDYGPMAIINSIDSSTGIRSKLKNAFGEKIGERLFALAAFLTVEGEARLYCKYFLEKTYGLSELSLVMTSQRISELLCDLKTEDVDKFFTSWIEEFTEHDYLALDITSISTYSSLMSFAGWGYNRDKEKLSQINYALICGVKSKLPIYLEYYKGEIKDISTMTNMLKQLPDSLKKKCMFVTDKGFSSKASISYMLEKDIHFLVSLPFTMEFSIKAIEKADNMLSLPSNTQKIGNDIIQMVTLHNEEWPESKKNVNVFVYRNDSLRLSAKKEIDLEIAEASSIINKDSENARKDSLVLKYYHCRKKYKGEEGEYIFTLRDDIYSSIKHTGYLVAISSKLDNAYEALRIYRDKDIVEKGHDTYKNRLGLERMRIHSDNRLEGFRLVSFIALTLRMWIHRGMVNAGLDSKYTVDEMFRIISAHKVHIMEDGTELVSTSSSTQKEIYKAMGIKKPV